MEKLTYWGFEGNPETDEAGEGEERAGSGPKGFKRLSSWSTADSGVDMIPPASWKRVRPEPAPTHYAEMGGPTVRSVADLHSVESRWTIPTRVHFFRRVRISATVIRVPRAGLVGGRWGMLQDYAKTVVDYCGVAGNGSMSCGMERRTKGQVERWIGIGCGIELGSLYSRSNWEAFWNGPPQVQIRFRRGGEMGRLVSLERGRGDRFGSCFLVTKGGGELEPVQASPFTSKR